MTETPQTIQTQRAALLSERESLEKTVGAAQAIWDRYPNGPDHRPNHNDDEHRRAKEARQAASDGRARIESITDTVKLLDKRLAFLEAGAAAPAAMRAARKEIEIIEKEAARLGGRRDQVAAKIALLREAAEQEAALAQAAEQSAAQAYASAVADGDEKAQQAAMEAIQRAQADTAAAHLKSSGQAGVLQALEAERDRLDEQRAALTERAEEQQNALYGALVAKCRTEWDQAADVLEAAGVRLVAAYSLAGHYLPLAKLKVPREAPDSADLDQYRLCRLAEGMQLPEIDSGLKQTLSALRGIKQALSTLLGRG